MKRTGGFTIVEMLIATVVIVILAAIGTVAYNKMRARAMDAKLEQEAAQLAHHLDAMIAKYGSQDEVVKKLGGLDTYSMDRDYIRNYLNMGEFNHIKMNYFAFFHHSPFGSEENFTPDFICWQRLSDDCSISYYSDQGKDKVFLEIFTSEDAFYNRGFSGGCAHDGSAAYDSFVFVVIRYYSHLYDKLIDYKTYHAKCR